MKRAGRAGAWLSLAATIAGQESARAARADGDVRQPGQTLTREIAASESHVFAVALEEGQLLDALIEPQGIDVAAILTEPDGIQAVKADESVNPMWD